MICSLKYTYLVFEFSFNENLNECYSDLDKVCINFCCNSFVTHFLEKLLIDFNY